jgi:hypothetical protein
VSHYTERKERGEKEAEKGGRRGEKRETRA